MINVGISGGGTAPALPSSAGTPGGLPTAQEEQSLRNASTGTRPGSTGTAPVPTLTVSAVTAIGEAGNPAAIAEDTDQSNDPRDLTPEEEAIVDELARRDDEVRRHEQAHAAVGGQYVGAPSYDFTRGPDGRQYATSGEVPIDAAPVPDDPEATIRKLQVVIRAALAPAEPSATDRQIAAQARLDLTEARAELTNERIEERQAATTPPENAAVPAIATQNTATSGRSTETSGPADSGDREGENPLSVSLVV